MLGKTKKLKFAFQSYRSSGLCYGRIPSNVILAEEFAKYFDGFSIGSNDLTQLVLGIDRDSAELANLFDERNEAVKRSIKNLIESAHRSKLSGYLWSGA
jgi:phosphoenolpyruvate synthase/pyruvate phosphate dikinase